MGNSFGEFPPPTPPIQNTGKGASSQILANKEIGSVVASGRGRLGTLFKFQQYMHEQAVTTQACLAAVY